MNPFDNLRPMPPSPCGCAPRPWPRPAVPVPITPQMQPHWAEELRRILVGKQDAISDLDDIREGAQAGATAYQKPEDGIPKTDLAADVQASLDKAGSAYVKPGDGIPKTDFEAGVQASLDKADTAVQPEGIAGFVDDAEYNAEYGTPPKPTILLKHGTTVVGTVDATDFVIDGMVSSVEIEDGNLVITFNTDSGKQPITIPLTDIFDPDNYYDKTAADGKFVAKEAGKGLSTEDYTTAEKTKLGGIAAGAQVNVIETVKVNGTALTPQDKAVNIPVPALDDAVTRTSANGVKSSGIWSALWGALASLPTGFSSLYDWCVAQLAGKASTADATLTERGFSEWICSPSNYDNAPIVVVENTDSGGTEFYPTANNSRIGDTKYVTVGTETITWNAGEWSGDGALTATRTALQGYQLGDQDDKPLASEAEAVALRTGKANDNAVVKLTGDQDIYGIKTFNGNMMAASINARGSVSANGITIKTDFNLNFLGSGNILMDGGSILVRGGFAIFSRTDGTQSPQFIILELDDEGASIGQYSILLPFASGTLALDTDLLTKLDASSASDAFSPDPSVSYPVGSHCTYRGKLYKCTTATTGGTWVAGSWTMDTMTDPDAVLDITAQNQLRVVAKDGTLLWAQGYDLASTSSATLACDAVNNFTFADGATTQAFALPAAPTGKVGDFGLDIDNSANTGAATLTLTGLDTTFSVVVPEGESLTDMLAIAAGELARFYITLSTFRVNNLPTWHIVKQVVENGGAQS